MLTWNKGNTLLEDILSTFYANVNNQIWFEAAKNYVVTQ